MSDQEKMSVANTVDAMRRLANDASHPGVASAIFEFAVERLERLELENKVADLSAANDALVARSVHAETLVNQDGLTGLYNHRAFRGFVEAVVESARSGLLDDSYITLLILDADKFKSFNDRYGHPAGDDGLRHLAHALSHSVRSEDIVARYGGEEFAVLIISNQKQGARIVKRMMNTVGDHPIRALQEKYGDLFINISIGMACVSGKEILGANELIELADNRLYDAKRSSRDRAVFQVGLNGKIRTVGRHGKVGPFSLRPAAVEVAQPGP